MAEEQRNSIVKCTICLDTALLNADGSKRVLAGISCSMAELFDNFKPCGFCPMGEREAREWKRWKEELARPLPTSKNIASSPRAKRDPAFISNLTTRFDEDLTRKIVLKRL